MSLFYLTNVLESFWRYFGIFEQYQGEPRREFAYKDATNFAFIAESKADRLQLIGIHRKSNFEFLDKIFSGGNTI